MKISTLVKGALIGTSFVATALCPPAGAAIGAYLGVTTASSIGASIGFGLLGVFAGGIAGGIVGGIVAAPGKIYLAVKAGKAFKKNAPSVFGTGFPDSATSLSNKQLKSIFDSAKKGVTPQAMPVVAAPKQAFRFGR